MGGYLDDFGRSDASHERGVRRVVLGLLLAVLLAFDVYLLLRGWEGKRRVSTFFDQLRTGNYQAAYETWGCTPQSPCRDYSMAKFLEDWGPKGVYGSLSGLRLGYARYCEDGVVRRVRIGREWISIFASRQEPGLSFYPLAYCASYEGLRLKGNLEDNFFPEEGEEPNRGARLAAGWFLIAALAAANLGTAWGLWRTFRPARPDAAPDVAQGPS
jgi:hypothetical protein